MVNQHRGQRRGPGPQSRRTNYTIVEEIPTGEEVLAGMFFLNERPIIILFDFGASHDFMSSSCAKRAKLSLVASGAPYMVSTPEGQVDVDCITQKVPLELSERVSEPTLAVSRARTGQMRRIRGSVRVRDVGTYA
jgi:hypothetical protein